METSPRVVINPKSFGSDKLSEPEQKERQDQVETNVVQDLTQSNQSEQVTANKAPKKKKKRDSYKSMMKMMMESNQSQETKKQEHQKRISNVTGGGQFKRGNLDKI